MRIRLPPARWLLAGWFVVLALLVAGPLLGSGHLLLLDFIGGPQAPSFSFMPLPSSGEVGNTIPLLTLHAALARVHPYVPQKLLLVAPIVLGGLGIARFAVRRLEVGPFPAAYAGTLYAVNPFVYDRLTAGQLHLLLGYGLLPWAFSALVRALDEPGPRRTGVIGLWLAALTAVSLHIAGMFALLVILGQVVGSSWRGLLRAGASLALAALLSAYWLVPSLFAPQGPRVGLADLEVYASRPQGPRVLPVLLGLNGFWRDEFSGATDRIPLLLLLLIPILSLSAVGIGRLVRIERSRSWAIALMIAAVLALLGAAGTSLSLTAGVTRWFVERLPFLGVYREPQKLLAIVALLYAVSGAVGASTLAEVMASRHERSRQLVRSGLVSAALVAAVLAYSFPILWGLGGQVSLARHPDGWSAAEATMQRTGPGRMLLLPWTQYGVRSFAGPRIIADPARSFFSEEMLSNDEAGFQEIGSQTRDPFSAYIGTILEERGDVRAFGHLIAPLGIRYVALFHEIDWREYGFLRRQPDLNEIYRDPDLELYENTAWRGDVLPLSGARSVGGLADVIGEPEEVQVTESLFLATPLVPSTGEGVPAIGQILPGARTIPPHDSSHVATGMRCTDGWRLGAQQAECLLGAVAAFSTPSEPTSLRSGFLGAWVIGYAVSALTLTAVFVYGRSWASSSGRSNGARTQTPRHRRRPAA